MSIIPIVKTDFEKEFDDAVKLDKIEVEKLREKRKEDIMKLADLIRDYVDKAIEYNICRQERDEDGYLYCCSTEKEAMEEAFIKLKGNLASHRGFIDL